MTDPICDPPDPQPGENPKVLSHNAIRRAIGGIGLGLPVVLLIYGWTFDRAQPSISHYYFTQMGDVFVGALLAIAVFLLCYRGYPEGPGWSPWLPGDRTMSILAAIGAIGVALFPTRTLPGRSICVEEGALGPCTILPESGAFAGPDLVTGLAFPAATMHSASAILFFAALAYFCLVLFPIGPKNCPGRKGELWTYYTCGTVIVGALIALAPMLGGLTQDSGPAVFWLETLAVWAFSVAWLVNGDMLARMRGFRLSPD